jgi:hypothetical protein
VTDRATQDHRYWLTPAGCLATGGHVPVAVTTTTTRCRCCGATQSTERTEA